MSIKAQTLFVDMDTAAGVQNKYITKDTAKTIAIAIRLTGAEAMFSYQFKVAFDTSCFSFVAAQENFGIKGESNILTKNGGGIIGICQFQTNPPAPDTIEYSYSITGTKSEKSVTGEGLAGVLYLKSKIRPGDSSSITIMQGYSASFGGDLIPIASYKGGMCKISPIVRIGYRKDIDKNYGTGKKIVLGNKGAYVTFAIPDALLQNNKEFRLRIFSLGGKLLAAHKIPVQNSKMYDTFLNQTGTFVYSLEIGNTSFTRTVTKP